MATLEIDSDSVNCVARWRSLYLLARSARSDVRHGAAVFVESDETRVSKS